MSQITISWDASPPSQGVTSYNIYRGTAVGNEAPTAYASVAVPAASTVTSVAASVGATAVYTGTFADGANNALAGIAFVVSGFTNPQNNGTFMVVASTTTTITVNSTTDVAESTTTTVQPNPYFMDGGVVAGHQYSYEITAVANGIESADSLGILSPVVPYPYSPPVVDIGPGISFEVLAGSAVTNTGATTASGDVGVWPGTSITGFGPPAAITGVFHSGDYVAQRAQTALTAAYNDAASRTPAVTISGDIGGQTLGPGVYNSTSTVGITGILTLDGGGNPDATWVFQVGSALTTAVSNSAVVMVNGGNAANVFWQIGSSATLNGGTTFVGVVMAQASITVGAGVNVNGRLLARTGAVTLISDEIASYSAASLINYTSGQTVSVGEIFYDCASQSYQQVIVGGVTSSTRPTFSPIIGVTTVDGQAVWVSLDPPMAIVYLAGSPPSGPNTPPSPPSAPTNPRIASES